MTQAITLHSSTILSQDIFNIPPEILAQILEDVYQEVNKTFGILMMVSKLLAKKIIPALRYIRRTVITNYKLARHLSGLVELFVVDGIDEDIEENQDKDVADLSVFSKNIWGNLEILSIPSRLIYQLNRNEWLDKFVDNPEECLDISVLLKISIHSRILPKSQTHASQMFIYGMKNLRILSVVESSGEWKGYNINPSAIPNVDKMILIRCFIRNLHEFSNLQHLSIRDCPLDSFYMKIINSLNLKVLIIHRPWSSNLQITLSNLRKLVIKGSERGMIEMLDISECINLESLNLYKVGKVTFGRMVNLHELVLDSSEFIPKNSKESIILTQNLLPSLRSLKIINCPHLQAQSIKESKDGKVYLRYVLGLRNL